MILNKGGAKMDIFLDITVDIMIDLGLCFLYFFDRVVDF